MLRVRLRARQTRTFRFRRSIELARMRDTHNSISEQIANSIYNDSPTAESLAVFSARDYTSEHCKYTASAIEREIVGEDDRRSFRAGDYENPFIEYPRERISSRAK